MLSNLHSLVSSVLREIAGCALLERKYTIAPCHYIYFAAFSNNYDIVESFAVESVCVLCTLLCLQHPQAMPNDESAPAEHKTIFALLCVYVEHNNISSEEILNYQSIWYTIFQPLHLMFNVSACLSKIWQYTALSILKLHIYVYI